MSRSAGQKLRDIFIFPSFPTDLFSGNANQSKIPAGGCLAANYQAGLLMDNFNLRSFGKFDKINLN